MNRVADSKIKFLEEKYYEIHRLAIEIITYGQVGHPGGSLAKSKLFTYVYFSKMNHDLIKLFSDSSDSVIAERLVKNSISYIPMIRIGVKEKFLEAGEIPDSLTKHETRPIDFVKEAEGLICKKKNIQLIEAVR